jgi:hypothetical protein
MTLAALLVALFAFMGADALDLHTALAFCHDVSPLVEFCPEKQTAPKLSAL